MRDRGGETRRLMRIERATGIDRKELRNHLKVLSDAGYLEAEISGIGRGGHEVRIYSVSESGRMLRENLARIVDICIHLGYYKDDVLFLPSDDL